MCLKSLLKSFLPYRIRKYASEDTRMHPNTRITTPWWASKDIKQTFRNHRRKLEDRDSGREMKEDVGKEGSLPKHPSVDSLASARSKEEPAETKTGTNEPYFLPTLHRNRPRHTGYPASTTGQQLPEGNQGSPPEQLAPREHSQEENFEHIQLDSDEDSEDDYVVVDRENEKVTERNGLPRNWLKLGRRK
jgi:hypothetical protein